MVASRGAAPARGAAAAERERHGIASSAAQVPVSCSHREKRHLPPSQADTADARTLSGEPVGELYTDSGSAGRHRGTPEDPIGRPGQYPFTRGVYESMYRGRLWTMRQFAGFGTSEETNERFHYLLEHGQTGLSTAFDMPSLMGYDSDSPRSLGEVGREGVAVDTVQDMRTLFAGIDLGEVSVSMTINAPAAIMLAFYVAAEARRVGGVPGEAAGSASCSSRARFRRTS